jgi:hypothetical protein
MWYCCPGFLCVPLQAPFYGMHVGQLMAAKLQRQAGDLLPLPNSLPPCLRQLCSSCLAADPAARPTMDAVVSRLNQCAVECLGEGWALGLFPDLARALVAARRQQQQQATAAAEP